MDCVISEHCDKVTILQKNYRKMTIAWSFSYNSFAKFNGKKIGSHTMYVLYPNPKCYEVFYKGTALYYNKTYVKRPFKNRPNKDLNDKC